MAQQDRPDDLDIPPYASQRHASRGFDPEMRRMALIAGALALLVVGVAMIWGGVHPRLGSPPVIKAPPGPMRTVPANPGGLQVPGANEQIMSGVVASGPPELAPPPPAPDLSRLASQTPPPPAPPPAPPSNPALSAASSPAPASHAPASHAPATTPSAAQPELQLPGGNQVVVMPPSGAGKPPPAAAPLPELALPPAAPGTQATPASPAAQPPAGGYAVQLAALGSRADANAAWARLRARAPGLLADRKPVIVPGEVKGQTWYRLRLEGFVTRTAAADLCDRLKALKVPCYVPR